MSALTRTITTVFTLLLIAVLTSCVSLARSTVTPHAPVPPGQDSGALLLDKHRVVESVIKVLPNPLDQAWSPDGKTLYLTHHSAGQISVIRHRQVVRTKYIGRNLTGIAITADGSTMYVGVAGENYVAVIDAKSLAIKHKIPTGRWPLGVRLAKDGRYIAVACYLSNHVEIISTATFEKRVVPVGSNPFYLAISKYGHRVFVANHSSANVTMISVELSKRRALKQKDIFVHVIKTLPVGRQPVCVALSDDEKHLYVANYGSGTVSVVDVPGERIEATWKVSTNPYWVAIHPKRAFVVVSHQRNPAVFLFYSNGKRTRVQMKNGGVNMLFSRDGKRLVVSNFHSQTISIIE
ncbi:MAG: YncE family protein [Myxococcales bacterium]|nr:YncE family protein [Myxococcales bacterium]